jgi:hypothetical protein
VAICHSAPARLVAITSTLLVGQSEQPTEFSADCGDLLERDQLERAHRINRDIALQVQRGLGQQIAEQRPLDERVGEGSSDDADISVDGQLIAARA